MFTATILAAGEGPAPHLLRVPGEGVQPQVAVDPTGVVHMVYMTGDAAASDINYVRLAADGKSFSPPIRVNSERGTGMELGTIRGARIAVGRHGRVHVAWNGSRNPAAMFYARMNDRGTAFEPQRNLMQWTAALDGGGTVAADQAGHVWVAWHAMGPVKGESHRRVYVARSDDDGRTFTRESPAWDEPTGACGCCGMASLGAGDGTVYLLYRAATRDVDRGMTLLVSRDAGRTYRGTLVQNWHINACPMSSSDIVPDGPGALLSWETEKQVYFSRIDPASMRLPAAVAPRGTGSRRFPAVAVNARGETILVWAEGTGWKKGGTLAWQVFDPGGAPEGPPGSLAGGVPVWSMPAVFARPDGGFTIVH